MYREHRNNRILPEPGASVGGTPGNRKVTTLMCLRSKKLRRCADRRKKIFNDRDFAKKLSLPWDAGFLLQIHQHRSSGASGGILRIRRYAKASGGAWSDQGRRSLLISWCRPETLEISGGFAKQINSGEEIHLCIQ